jgi:hypothetical protein
MAPRPSRVIVRLWIRLNRNVRQYPSKQRLSFLSISINEFVSLMFIAKLFQISDIVLSAVNDSGIASYFFDLVFPSANRPLKFVRIRLISQVFLPVKISFSHLLSIFRHFIESRLESYPGGNTNFSTFQRLTYLPSYSTGTSVKLSGTF